MAASVLTHRATCRRPEVGVLISPDGHDKSPPLQVAAGSSQPEPQVAHQATGPLVAVAPPACKRPMNMLIVRVCSISGNKWPDFVHHLLLATPGGAGDGVLLVVAPAPAQQVAGRASLALPRPPPTQQMLDCAPRWDIPICGRHSTGGSPTAATRPVTSSESAAEFNEQFPPGGHSQFARNKWPDAGHLSASGPDATGVTAGPWP